MRRLVVGLGLVGALGGLCVVLAPSSNALTAVSGGASGGPTDCQTTPGDTFETPVVPPHTFRSVRAGQTIGPWTVTGKDVDLIGAGFWQAADGVQSVDLEGSAVPNYQGGVKRVFDTPTLLPLLPLSTYKLTYCLAGNFVGLPTVKTGQVLVNGAPAQDFSFDSTGKNYTNMGYKPMTLSFTPSGPTTTVEFRSTTNPHGYGPVIDKVNIKECFLGLFCS